MNHHFFKTIMVGALAATLILGGGGCKKSPSVVDVPVTAFSLSATSLELKIDETKQLDVLFFPEMELRTEPRLICLKLRRILGSLQFLLAPTVLVAVLLLRSLRL